MEKKLTQSLAYAAISNPMFAEQVQKLEPENNKSTSDNNNLPEDKSVLHIDENELQQIKIWERRLKVAMLCLSTVLIILSWFNLYAMNILAFYLFFFAVLLCCFELGVKQVALFIVMNFGFLYSLSGRIIFFVFISFICFELSTFGIVAFALIIAYIFVILFVYYKHPQYGKYIRTKHYFNVARAKETKPLVINV
jgi:lysylphosphatidylglycerol synthetase-like protein (DUF2156 family)